LVNNQFIYFKISVKEGWINRETGKKSEPRITFQDAKFLADILPTFAKKLSIHLNILDLNPNLILKLSELFKANSGENLVNFEVLEIEKVTKVVEQNLPVAVPILSSSEESDLDTDVIDLDAEMEQPEMEVNLPVTVDENRVVTRLAMPSRKLKVKITKELLEELDKVPVNYKLN